MPTPTMIRPTAPARGRTCHILDLECVFGGTDATPDVIRGWWTEYRNVVGITPGDRVVAGVSHRTAKIACFALLGEPIQWLFRSGKDGGETVLVESLDLDLIARRYDRLVIGGADKLMIPVVRQATARGLRVQLVSGVGKAGRELLEICPDHVILRPSVATLRLAA